MQIITTHMNTDFDALASVVAAKKLYPEAQIVLTDQQDRRVKKFLSIYRDAFDYVYDHRIDWAKVDHLILVDVANPRRASHQAKNLRLEEIKVTIYDHHPVQPEDLEPDAGQIETIGAAVTLLVEEIRDRQLPITSLEATLFGLGLYTDTGNFTYKQTKPRDLAVASYLLEEGMNLDLLRRFMEENLLPEQQALLDQLFHTAELIEMDGLHIVLSQAALKKHVGGLSVVTEKMRSINGADAVINIVEMGNRSYIVGRASSPRISLLPILESWGGGGHRQAGSALIREAKAAEIYEEVKAKLETIISPALTARDIMAAPVKTLTPDTTIERAGELMYRYGHSGYPIVEEDKLLGLITRRDLDKANHHGLGHAPVKAYMTTNLVTIQPSDPLELIQETIIAHNVGRLPVLEEGKLVGILTRTNLIEAIHSESLTGKEEAEDLPLKDNLEEEMRAQLPSTILSLLENIGQMAEASGMNAYLVGGIVRDIFLNRPNDDIDIVVEGDGIQFAKQLQEKYAGDLINHEDFGTATWETTDGLSIDIASSRLEYYEGPASLPDVEGSTLDEDLYRRDFTINAMALCLNTQRFGELVDPFTGQRDLLEQSVKVLHNISFIEDPTRIFRAVRFAARFGFEIDQQTKSLALHSIDKIKNLSEKRILNEMARLFGEIEPAEVIARLFELNFWQQYGIPKDKASLAQEQVTRLARAEAYREDLDFRVDQNFKYFLVPFYVSNRLKEAEAFALKRRENRLITELERLSIELVSAVESLGQAHRLLRHVSDDALVFFLATAALENEALIRDYLEKRRHIPVYVRGEELGQLGIKRGPLYAEILLQLDMRILDGDIDSEEAAHRWIRQQFIEE